MTVLQSIAQKIVDRSKDPANPLQKAEGDLAFYKFMFYGMLFMWVATVATLSMGAGRAQETYREQTRTTETLRLYGARTFVDGKAVVSAENLQDIPETP